MVHYCCGHCRAAGIEHVAEESCELIHEEAETGCCKHHHHSADCHHHNGCWFKHLTVNQGGISSSQHAPAVEQLQVLHCIMPLAAGEVIRDIFAPQMNLTRGDPGRSPSPVFGRIVLSRDCRLAL